MALPEIRSLLRPLRPMAAKLLMVATAAALPACGAETADPCQEAGGKLCKPDPKDKVVDPTLHPSCFKPTDDVCLQFDVLDEGKNWKAGFRYCLNNQTESGRSAYYTPGKNAPGVDDASPNDALLFGSGESIGSLEVVPASDTEAAKTMDYFYSMIAKGLGIAVAMSYSVVNGECQNNVFGGALFDPEQFTSGWSPRQSLMVLPLPSNYGYEKGMGIVILDVSTSGVKVNFKAPLNGFVDQPDFETLQERAVKVCGDEAPCKFIAPENEAEMPGVKSAASVYVTLFK